MPGLWRPERGVTRPTFATYTVVNVDLDVTGTGSLAVYVWT
jgi:hypothetical protein